MSESRQPEFQPELQPLPTRAADLVGRLAGLAESPDLRDALLAVADDLRREPPAPSDPARRLADAFHLTPFEYDVLLLVGLPEEHEAIAQLARRWSPSGEPLLTSSVLARALDLDAAGRRHLRRALEQGSLRTGRLVSGPESVPLPERSLRLPAGLWSVARGVDCWPTTLRPRRLPLDRAHRPPDAARLAEALGGEARLVLVTGGERSDADLAFWAASALTASSRTAVVLDGPDADADRAPGWSAHVLARGAVPVVLGRPPEPPLPTHPGPVVVAAAAGSGVPLDDRPTVTVDLGPQGIGAAVAMWRRLLPELNGSSARLAGVLRLDEPAALRAIADCRLDGAAPSVAGVLARVRQRTDVSLPPAVRLERPRTRFEHLVLPDEQQRLLRSVVRRVGGAPRVLHDWGFGIATRSRGGARVLLSGPPGTGKTLAAGTLAAELGLDLLAVDLAALVSKWLGETEKNLGEVFDAAERCSAVLFFDEADAVFARRTEGSDANARWANLETAYLLGRIDRFDGLVVLATNLRSRIDDAFLRRLDVVVELDEPDRAARERLWRLHLPARAPLATEVDLRALAAMYEIPGGLIRNAALAAAFEAAADGGAIEQQHLIRAVSDEYRKAGRSFPGFPRPPVAAHPAAGRERGEHRGDS